MKIKTPHIIAGSIHYSLHQKSKMLEIKDCDFEQSQQVFRTISSTFEQTALFSIIFPGYNPFLILLINFNFNLIFIYIIILYCEMLLLNIINSWLMLYCFKALINY